MNSDNLNEENFEALLDQSLLKGDSFSIGDEVTGKIVLIAKESIFVDISGKSEAIIDKSEFIDENGKLTVKNGDNIKAFIVSLKKGEIQITTKIGKSSASIELIEKAKTFGIPIEGTITDITNGGYQVSVSGISCFCPFSQIDVKSPSSPETMLSKSFSFKVMQITEKGRNIVISRRALLEEKREQAEKELRNKLKVGDIVSGKIISTQQFGIFIDIGGMEALIPKTEISWGRKIDMESFRPGLILEAKVISIDWENKRIALSLKQAKSHPWDNIDKYKIGKELNGRVVNIIKNGAFVELEPGIEGFIPISRMSTIKRINKPEDAVSLNSTVCVKIIEINKTDKKISFELVTGEPDPWQMPLDSIMDNIFTGQVEAVKNNGITVRLANGMVGFLQREECAVKKGTDLQNAYTIGKEVKVVIKDIENKARKLKLSEIEALKKEERQEYQKFMKESDTGIEEGSAFGKLFKQKFEEARKKPGSPES